MSMNNIQGYVMKCWIPAVYANILVLIRHIMGYVIWYVSSY